MFAVQTTTAASARRASRAATEPTPATSKCAWVGACAVVCSVLERSLNSSCRAIGKARAFEGAVCMFARHWSACRTARRSWPVHRCARSEAWLEGCWLLARSSAARVGLPEQCRYYRRATKPLTAAPLASASISFKHFLCRSSWSSLVASQPPKTIQNAVQRFK